MADYMEALGGVQIYLSGFRTDAEQQRLFQRAGTRPVAAPGCSQHQYGYAVDLAWGLLREESPIGHFSPKEIESFMGEVGRILGLTTVARDPGHFQIFPGADFRNWAVLSGFCVPPPPISEPFQRVVGRIEELCGPGFARVQIRRGVVTCGLRDSLLPPDE